LLPNVELKLVDDNGDPITQDDKTGQALIRSPTMFLGYLGNPDANKEAFDRDGFYRTGDQVHVQNNKLFHDGRIKDTMKVKGWQVSPTELEVVLVEHPQIVDAAVVGVSHENRYGIQDTLPRAYVVRASTAETSQASDISSSPSSGLTEQNVKDFVASKLISYKHLTGGVVFVKQIPRSPTGKILRLHLDQAELDASDLNTVQPSSSPLGGSSPEDVL
jgi:acyl-coenzyme A synthetase/AMP-(fatty) acid ligase